MPRVCTSASDPIDFCVKHMPSPEQAEAEYGDVGDGPDGRGNCYEYEADHPCYSDIDGFYTCEICDKELTSKDN